MSNKLSVIILVFCIWFISFSVTLHDLLDPNINMQWLQHGLLGESFKYSLSITNHTLVAIIFWLEKCFEILFLIIIGSGLCKYVKARDLKSTNHAKGIILFGLALVAAKYLLLFVGVMDEWFYQWVNHGTTQLKALMDAAMVVIVMIYTKIID